MLVNMYMQAFYVHVLVNIYYIYIQISIYTCTYESLSLSGMIVALRRFKKL